MDDVKLFLNSENNVNVFGICETFLNETVEDKTLKIAGYQFERKDRENCTTSDKTHGVELSYTSLSILTTYGDMISNRSISSPFGYKVAFQTVSDFLSAQFIGRHKLRQIS